MAETTKSPLANDTALSLKKFCNVCNLHTVHVEGK